MDQGPGPHLFQHTKEQVMDITEDLTGTTTPVYDMPFANKIIDHQTWLQYRVPQGNRFISISRYESDGSIHIWCVTQKDEKGRDYGAIPLIEVGSNGLVITAKQEDEY